MFENHAIWPGVALRSLGVQLSAASAGILRVLAVVADSEHAALHKFRAKKRGKVVCLSGCRESVTT